MASYNKVFLMGNLTRNPEIRKSGIQTTRRQYVLSGSRSIMGHARSRKLTSGNASVSGRRRRLSRGDSPEKVPPFWLRAPLRMSNGRTEKPERHGAKRGFMSRT